VPAADESLKLAQVARPRLVIVARERVGVPHEFLEFRASLPNVLFEQRPVNPCSPPQRGVLVAGGGHSADSTL
jgi:hypothetical protein